MKILKIIIFLATVICVTVINAAQFTDNGDGTVSDTMNNLRWQKCSMGQTIDSVCSGTAAHATWPAALTYCSGLNLATKIWRLPNLNELMSIVDFTHNNPSVDINYFPGTDYSNGVYWTSTSYSADTWYAWAVFFAGGSNSTLVKPDPNNAFVRCVTNGP